MAKRPKPPPSLAFQDDALLEANPLVVNRTLDQMKKAGSKGLRINAIWGQVRKNGAYDWSKIDALANAARARGIAPQLTLMGTPSYMKARNLDEALSAGTPNQNLMQAFASEAAQHFRGRVGKYSIWNEPNISSFLAEGENRLGPKQYRRLYQSGYKGIKSIDPKAKVLFGELTSGIAGGPERQQALSFMRNVLAAGNKPLLADGLALHPYQWSNPNTKPESRNSGGIGNLPAVQKELKRLFHKGRFATPQKNKVPLYLTEMGYRKNVIKGEAKRARYTQRAYELARAAGAKQFLQYQYLPTVSHQPVATDVQDPSFNIQNAYGGMTQITPNRRTVWGTREVPSSSTWDTSIADMQGNMSPAFQLALKRMKRAK